MFKSAYDSVKPDRQKKQESTQAMPSLALGLQPILHLLEKEFFHWMHELAPPPQKKKTTQLFFFFHFSYEFHFVKSLFWVSRPIIVLIKIYPGATFEKRRCAYSFISWCSESWAVLFKINNFFGIQIPEEEKNFGPHNRLIHVYHFTTETAQNQLVRLHTYAEIIISLSCDNMSGRLEHIICMNFDESSIR